MKPRLKHPSTPSHQQLLTVTFLVCLLVPALPAKDFVLVEEGRPAATIVTAAIPSENARAAAVELQRYVRKISGAELPVVPDDQSPAGPLILVGPSRLTVAGKSLWLCAPAVVNEAWVWVNGQYAGHRQHKMPWFRPQSVELDITSLVRPGQRNQITFRVLNNIDVFGASGIYERMFLHARAQGVAAE